MKLVRELFHVVDLADGVEQLRAGRLPARAVAVTFDDGYANNRRIAAPILVELGMSATFFVATGFLNGTAMWNDRIIEALRRAPDHLDLGELGLGKLRLSETAARRQAVDELLGKLKYLEPRDRLQTTESIESIVGLGSGGQVMMDESDVRDLAAMGMSVGAHSVTHPILTRLSDDAARHEIHESKHRLEAVIRARVRTFAYPNGRPERDYQRKHVEMVRSAGFEAAVSTAWGSTTSEGDPFQIPRIAPWDRGANRYALRMLRAQIQRRGQLAS